MRKLTLLLILATITTLPAIAARRVTVEQLEQALATAHGRPDAEVALQLSDLELTERLSAGRFAKLRAEMPGEASEHGLTALADLSEFLNPPATEIPATPTPTLAAQRQMMALVVTYVTQTTHQLPNFFATRKTNRFEDLQHLTDKPVPLYFVAKSSKTVFYRDGKELVTTAEGKVKAERSDTQGLVSWGEFGPILGTVLLDAARSKLAWSHWEQGAGGPEAVFGYAVTGEKSHYSVHFCCVMGASGASDPFNKLAVYHGEIAVDPATGAILRLTLEADFDTDSPVTKAAIMVEYGDQEIGGKSFTCPVRSVAISVVQPTYSTYDSSGMRSIFSPQPHKTYLNDVAFGQYHRLGSEARILTDASDEPPANPPASVPEAVASPNSQPAPAGLPASTETAPAPTSAPVAAAAPAQPPATEPETSVEAANGIPNAPVNAPAPAGGAIVLKMTSRLVDVGVVVVDKKGHPVGDLKPEDFELLDNGRKQEIKFFSEIVGTAAGEGAAATGNPSGATGELDRTFSNRPDDTSGTGTGTVKPAAATEGDSTILLLDESHISWDDLSNARREMLKFLNALAPGERVGLYTLTGLGFRVLTEATSDHAALIARLNKWMPDAQSVSQAQEEETRNRQHFDTVRNLSDLGSVNGNETAVPDGATPVDPKLLALGDNPGRASLLILSTVARHLAALPGHKSLVWVSSDNVFVNWNDLTVSSNKVTDGVDLFALHAQEAMNDAHVAVYPFDVSQLEAGGVSADLKNRNVEADPTGGGTLARDMTNGRDKAEMLQDTRPIQGPIRQLAEATGGRTIQRSGELAKALAGIVQDGHATYQLSFYPDTPSDDKYHTIAVKLADKKGLTLRYRTGYLYAKEPATMKERFQQAVWRPIDADEIKVTGAIDATHPGASLKINVATSDLGLQQQAGRWMDKLDFFFIQRDDAGLHAEVEGQTLGLRLTPATYQNVVASGVPFEHLVNLKPGVASLRVLMVDENSGRMGSVTIPAPALGGAL